MKADFEIIGRATRDVELVELPNKTKKANISLATNEGDATYYYNLIAYEKKAETLYQYLKKGNQIFMQGKIKPRSYEKDGVKKYIIDFVVSNFEFLSNGSSTNEQPNPNDIF